MADSELSAVGDRIAFLLEHLRSSVEPRVWPRVEELVRLLTELYGAGMEKVVEVAGDHPELLERLASDELVGSLLVLHGLHPDSLEQRVAGALRLVEGRLGKAGAAARVERVDAGAARVEVAVTVAGTGCGSTAEALRAEVTQALEGAAPDAEVAVRVDGGPAPVQLGRKPSGLGVAVSR